jgi:hypothetical protein
MGLMSLPLLDSFLISILYGSAPSYWRRGLARIALLFGSYFVVLFMAASLSRTDPGFLGEVVACMGGSTVGCVARVFWLDRSKK